MKSAEEWVGKEQLTLAGGSIEQKINLLKKVQIDAWRQGMIDASCIVDKFHQVIIAREILMSLQLDKPTNL